MAKKTKTIAEIKLEKPKKKGGFVRFLLILVILILLVTLVRRSIAGSGEKKGN